MIASQLKSFLGKPTYLFGLLVFFIFLAAIADEREDYRKQLLHKYKVKEEYLPVPEGGLEKELNVIVTEYLKKHFPNSKLKEAEEAAKKKYSVPSIGDTVSVPTARGRGGTLTGRYGGIINDSHIRVGNRDVLISDLPIMVLDKFSSSKMASKRAEYVRERYYNQLARVRPRAISYAQKVIREKYGMVRPKQSKNWIKMTDYVDKVVEKKFKATKPVVVSNDKTSPTPAPVSPDATIAVAPGATIVRREKLKAGARSGNLAMMIELAEGYGSNGVFGEDDDKQLIWYDKAGKAGSAESSFKAASLFARKKDYEAVRAHLKRAAIGNYSEAYIPLARMLESGKGGSVDSDGAKRWYRNAWKNSKSPNVRSALVQLLENDNAEKDPTAELIELYKDGVKDDDPYCLRMYGQCLEFGHEVKVNSYQAVKLYSAAAEAGDKVSQKKVQRLREILDGETE